ncbi:MAG TPA: glycosyl hydrolase family 28-related protein [Allosphingosinicella sp.]|nr:glycosyl hydrolase family 28-related protein [Allosphingosinicella sp.]
MATQSTDYTYAAAQAATIPATVGTLELQDRGHSYWRRVATEPAHPGKFRSQDRFLPNGTTDSTNGGYWEFQPADGIVDVEEFGLVGDGTTDNSAAMTDLLTFIRVKQVNPFDAVNIGGYRIRFPIGHFYFSEKIDLKSTVIIEGQGTGLAGGFPTKLRFATDGIILNAYHTIDGGAESPPTTTAGGTIIRNLMLTSSATSGAHDGIWMRARATLEQVSVHNFPRYGVRIEAEGLSAAAPVRGNANNWRMIDCRLIGNGDCGLFVSGGDVNAGIGTGIDSSFNGNWGIWDNSFLGNAYIGCHTDYNGIPGASVGRSAPAVVTHSGRYYAVVPGQDAAASTTTPGTNAWVWFEYWPSPDGPATGAAAWSSSATYKSGGAYALIGDAATGNLLLGCYSEGAQGPSFLGFRSMSINGTHGAGIGGHGCATRGAEGLFESRLGFLTATDRTGGSVSLGGNPGNGDILRIGHSTYAPYNNRLIWKGDGNLSFNYNSGIDKEPFFLTGVATTTQFGTSAVQPHVFALDKLALGAGYIGEDGGRRITYRSAAPAAGAWARGDFVFNLNPSTGAPFGWRCTVAGTPGTWEAVAASSGSVTDGDKGDVTVSGSGTVWSVDSDSVTNAKLANMAANRIKGASSAGDPQDLTPAQARTVIASDSGNGAHFLAGDGTFKAPPTWTVDYTSNRASYYNLTPASLTHMVFNTSNDGNHAVFLQNAATGTQIKLSRLRGGQAVTISGGDASQSISYKGGNVTSATILDGGTVFLTKVANNQWVGEGDFT